MYFKFNLKAGFISPELDVICKINEYNAYREYLLYMQGQLLRKEIEKEESTIKEKFVLKLSSDFELRRMER